MITYAVYGDDIIDREVVLQPKTGYCRETGVPRHTIVSQQDLPGGALRAQALLSQLEGEGVRRIGYGGTAVERLGAYQRPPSLRIRHYDETGEPLWQLDENNRVTQEHEALYDATDLGEAFRGVDALLISDYGLGGVRHLHKITQWPPTVVVNTKDPWHPQWQALPEQAVVICNQAELEKSTLQHQQNPRAYPRPLVVTNGERSVLVQKPGVSHISVCYVPRVTMTPQTIGAGDTFVAGFLSTWAKDTRAERCLVQATDTGIAAALVYVQHPFRQGHAIPEFAAEVQKARQRLTDATLAYRPSTAFQARHAVVTNGCFDLLHDGHRQLLRYCQELGGQLFVLVDNDESVARLKGRGRPIRSFRERVMDVAYAAGPDAVVSELFHGDVSAVLAKLSGDAIYVKGAEYKPLTTLPAFAGRVLYAPMLPGVSTSGLLDL